LEIALRYFGNFIISAFMIEYPILMGYQTLGLYEFEDRGNMPFEFIWNELPVLTQ
jgi:hypothetical protein